MVFSLKQRKEKAFQNERCKDGGELSVYFVQFFLCSLFYFYFYFLGETGLKWSLLLVSCYGAFVYEKREGERRVEGNERTESSVKAPAKERDYALFKKG